MWGPRGKDSAHGCRCFDCSQAAVLYEKRRIAARARGDIVFVDATEARNHIEWLSTQGVGSHTVATRAGVPRSTIQRLRRGTLHRIRPATAERILAVHTLHAAPNARVPAARTVAQLDDLVNVVGLTKRAIALQLGKQSPQLQVAQRGGTVTKRNADLVDALWRRHMAPILARRETDAAERARYRARQRQGG